MRSSTPTASNSLGQWPAGWRGPAPTFSLAQTCWRRSPLHWARLLSRRYNQAAELTRELSAYIDLPWDPMVLTRVKATHPQVGLSKSQRGLNVQGAFRVSEAAQLRIFQKKIILVDDVLTSGATLDAAARALVRAGAGGVDVLVFARVVNGM